MWICRFLLLCRFKRSFVYSTNIYWIIDFLSFLYGRSELFTAVWAHYTQFCLYSRECGYCYCHCLLWIFFVCFIFQVNIMGFGLINICFVICYSAREMHSCSRNIAIDSEFFLPLIIVLFCIEWHQPKRNTHRTVLGEPLYWHLKFLIFAHFHKIDMFASHTLPKILHVVWSSGWLKTLNEIRNVTKLAIHQS